MPYGAQVGGQLIAIDQMDAIYLDLGASTTTYRVQLNFGTDGFLDVLRNVGADDLQDLEVTNKTSNLHIRCVYVSGEHLTSGNEDTWEAWTVARNYQLEHASGGGSDDITGTFNFQISKDGGSTVFQASGNVSINVGELF